MKWVPFHTLHIVNATLLENVRLSGYSFMRRRDYFSPVSQREVDEERLAQTYWTKKIK